MVYDMIIYVPFSQEAKMMAKITHFSTLCCNIEKKTQIFTGLFQIFISIIFWNLKYHSNSMFQYLLDALNRLSFGKKIRDLRQIVWIACSVKVLHFVQQLFWIHYRCTKNVFQKAVGQNAVTCMEVFFFNQNWQFNPEDGYFWPYCCINNLNISHRSLYAPTYSFWAIIIMFISRFWVTSWFYSVCNIVAYWMNLR